MDQDGGPDQTSCLCGHLKPPLTFLVGDVPCRLLVHREPGEAMAIWNMLVGINISPVSLPDFHRLYGELLQDADPTAVRL